MTTSDDGGALGLNDYQAPVADLLEALDVAGFDEVLKLPAYADVDRGSVELAVAELARFVHDVIVPTDAAGDHEGSHLDPSTGRVRTPTGFKAAYDRYVAGGWGAIAFPVEHGGGGLPALIGIVQQEMLASANTALSLNPVLTQSAIELLLAWGSEDQQARYLPKLITGEWCGTMNLTEPEAGSDLGEVQTRAALGEDGRWRLSGTKIFITWGEHDLADNIVHLVLARTEGAPPGTKGLSLFVVPKVLVGPDGALGEGNAVHCLRVEGKLGIHGSPTCVMEYEDAVGELVGEEQGGIRAMFTMMNTARLSVGLQGPSAAERAYQHARRYADERRQGRALGVAPPARSVLSEHPDVRRMLLTMRTCTLASRLLIYTATVQRDIARHGPDPETRATAQALVDLLTPVAKAWSSDVGCLVASTGMQVLGGAGYIEESGMAQRLRDVRIAPIYEGTNGIQAIDLVTRKLPQDEGRWVSQLLADITATISPRSVDGLGQSYAHLAEAVVAAERTTEQLLVRVQRAPEDALAGATAYLELFGLTLGGWLLVRRAERAARTGSPGASVAAGESEFFATEHVARVPGLVGPVLAGAGRLAWL